MQYFHRLLERPISAPASRGKVRLLFGARQTGKSTLLRRLLGEGSPALFIDLQDSSRRREFERRPRALSEMLLARKEKRLEILVDEIQKVPALLEEVQWLFDQHPGRFEFYLTGSSARRLRRSAANLLPGRSHLFHLGPVLQAERGVQAEALPIPGIPRAPHFPKRSLADCLLLGSLPGPSLENRARAERSLQGYSELYLEEEIRREGLVRDVGAFSRFLELAALESGQTMNLAKLSNESGIPVATLRLYYQILIDTFTGYWLEPFATRSRKRLLTTPKFFLFDLGVRNAAARLPLDASLLRLHGGALLEQWVGLELIHRVKHLGTGYRVGFWRTVGGAEVDFVIGTPRETVPIEVKWTDRPTPQDARHLELFLKDSPGDRPAKRGYVVCRVPDRRRLTERVTALPWDQL
jgi:uncharacterized protein